MLGRLLSFLIYAVIILFVAWIVTLILGFIPVIPGELKDIVNIVVWFVAFIAIIIAAKRVFVDGASTPTA